MDLSGIANIRELDYSKIIDSMNKEMMDLPTQHMFSDTQFEIIKKYIQDQL